jgi:hypothetical protein
MILSLIFFVGCSAGGLLLTALFCIAVEFEWLKYRWVPATTQQYQAADSTKGVYRPYRGMWWREDAFRKNLASASASASVVCVDCKRTRGALEEGNNMMTGICAFCLEKRR